jgi:predicted site-specific integrase-resolvase
MVEINNSLSSGGRLLSPIRVAEILGVSVDTLAVWRCTQRYPLPYVKVGRKVMYRREDVERFIVGRIEGASSGGRHER